MNESVDSQQVDAIENHDQTWYPRTVLRQTNRLYRVDVSRPNNIIHLSVLWDTIIILSDFATHFKLTR